MLLALFMLIAQPVEVSDNLSITYEGKEIKSLHRSEVALSPFHYDFIDESKFIELTDSLESNVFREPVNASLDQHGRLISEKTGLKLNRELWKKTFYTRYFSEGPATIELPTETLYPKVDGELLSSIKEKMVGQYITFFNSRNGERTHNIKLASDAINNYVIFPGEIFSFNAVVGKRTVEKGYLPAPVIVRGELSEGIGGGICQVSSTLFNAVDKAGVKILERYSHSRKVPYVPPNRDATVSWYGPDFTFKNEYNQPLLVRSKVIGGQLIVTIFSSDTIQIH
ncbi:VanW family protein [Metabacillus halosaccharovorans]|uniref:VanW family protein n=1 Tax=Metabacillus halosaccharovorans TaxID=930124 RepID=A0ABT3DHF5_9BACI|nr:VanW family protein [Metabacillus halosaccharovorans]MCV9886436.1 VanW family protein [Metabacillus halosaccharovorans]